MKYSVSNPYNPKSTASMEKDDMHVNIIYNNAYLKHQGHHQNM